MKVIIDIPTPLKAQLQLPDDVKNKKIHVQLKYFRVTEIYHSGYQVRMQVLEFGAMM